MYGLALPPAYLVDPFVAQSIDYGRILVTWNKPTAPAGSPIFQYRLLSNRYGFPVNENDGNILLDSGTPAPGAASGPYPGSQYVDQAVLPASYHYYGFYVLVDITDNIWIRAGVTCCLANADFGSAGMMLDLIPEHFKTQLDGNELTTDAVGNTYLQQFLNVLGWGMDYLRTQYWAAANYMNNPLAMPINDLWNMATELGLDFSPEVPAYTMRKAVNNAAHVFRERGTLAGLRNEVVLRTSWDSDVTVGPNILLHDDQSQFLSNIALYEPNTYYQTNDLIQVYWDHVNHVFVYPDAGRLPWLLSLPNITGYVYRSLADYNQFGAAIQASLGSSNAYWQLITDAPDVWHHMDNPVTGLPSTWEVIDSSAVNGIPAPGSVTLGTGVPHPLVGTMPATSLRINNTAGTAKTMWARSVCRRNIELGNITDGGFELGITLPGRHLAQPGWVPGNWPAITWEPADEIGGWWPSDWWRGPYHVPAYWTLNNCTIQQSTNYSYNGTHSAVISPQGFIGLATTVSPCSASSTWAQCPAGTAVTGSIWVRPAGAGTSGALSTTIAVAVQWFDQWGTSLSENWGAWSSPAAGVFTQFTTGSHTAPANTHYCALLIAYGNAKATDIIYVDGANLAVTATQPPTWPVELTQAIQDGLPVPWVRDSQEWSPATRYGTGDIALYQNQPFVALRASTGALPPTNCIPTPEWAPLSESRRIRLAVSAYTSQNMTNSANLQCAVIPFVEWFDKHGNWIARVFARQPGTGGTVGKPDQLAYDSFTSLSIVATGGSSGTVAFGPWQASYYTNTTLTGAPALTRTDASIGLWTSGQSPGPGIPASGWSAAWVNSFTPSTAGTYTFAVQCTGGGARIIVNGVTVVNNWNHPKTTAVPSVPPVYLNAATSASIVVQYYDALVPGVAKVTAIPAFAPHTVTGLRAYSWTDTTISIAWDAMALATSYQVRVTYQAPNGAYLELAHMVTGESYTITGLAASQTYGVHVVAINSVAWAPEASIVQQTGGS